MFHHQNKMNDIKFQDLLGKLDKEYEKLTGDSLGESEVPESNPQVSPNHFPEVATPVASGIKLQPGVDFEKLSENQLLLSHTLLHLFYSNNCGDGLTRPDIIHLHSKLSEKLSSHSHFDRLDSEKL